MKSKALLLFILIAVLMSLLVYSQWKVPQRQISGVLEADEIRVGSRLGGRVAEVLVEEGEKVQIGDLLLRLEPYDLRERLAEAQSMLAARQAEYDKLRTGLRPQEIAQSRSRVERSKAMLDKLKAGDKVKFKAINDAGKFTVTEIQPVR